MALERTFSIIKPDATERNLTGAVNAVIEGAGLRIVAQKRIRMTRREAETFYAVHRERPFFGELVEFMTSGPVVVQVLEGENAVVRYREIMGATNPENAAPGTIRKQFARSVGENSVHGSDSVDNAKIEIAQFFAGNELVGSPPVCSTEFERPPARRPFCFHVGDLDCGHEPNAPDRSPHVRLPARLPVRLFARGRGGRGP
jgi:nucleoside-diphosphate kinase